MPTDFQGRLATISQQQYAMYRWFRENQEPLASQIRAYWEELGFSFPGVQQAWSAVFVSWCVKQAGATAEQFRFDPMHSQFVYRAIANAEAGIGVFHGHPVADYSPRVGDILHNNRSGYHYDFAYARKHRSYASHSAIIVEVGEDSQGRYLRTVGGNESDSVGMKEVRLDSDGFVFNNDGLYTSIIETLL